MKGVLPHLLLARGFGLTTWPTAKVRLSDITQDETSAFLGICRIIRLEKTPDAIREQRGATHWNLGYLSGRRINT
jgi:hypothetical protein